MSETKVAAEKKRSSLVRGLIAGFIGGVAGTAASIFAERIFPPQPKPAPPNLAAGRESADAPAPLAKAMQSDAFRWGLGAVTGAAYGAVAEFYPEATVRLGAGFGLALEELNGEAAPVPGRASQSPTPVQPAQSDVQIQPQTASERTRETATYLVYGVTTELVRRLVRRWL
jgi:putative membrane protein